MTAGHARKQAGVLAGMIVGLALTIGAVLWPVLPPVGQEPEARLEAWGACAVVVGLCLFVTIALLARHRFFSPADIDGGGMGAATPRAAVLQAILQNTLEQAVLATIAHAGWLLIGPADRGGLTIVFAGYFVIGRLLFGIGYAEGAVARALGFALTFYPSAGLLLLLLPRLF